MSQLVDESRAIRSLGITVRIGDVRVTAAQKSPARAGVFARRIEVRDIAVVIILFVEAQDDMFAMAFRK